MNLLQHVADIGITIFFGIASWVGILLVTGFVLQWIKDAISERKRVKHVAKQDPWGVE